MHGASDMMVLLATALAAASVQARPYQQQQLPLQATPDVTATRTDNSDFNVLHHLSGISPFFESHGPDPSPPEGCVVISAAILARHSSITMNDDEWPETMGPFTEKLPDYQASGFAAAIPDDSPLAFLRDWETPVNEDNMEELTKPGADDAKAFGQRLRKAYKHILPGNKDPAFKVYTASSGRDVDSSNAFISGMYPERVIGTKRGQVNLVKVPNKAKEWASSLTPHKSCNRFDKAVGKPERNAFQAKYAGPVIDRLNAANALPGWNWNWTDVVAMQQMCGYETVIRGSSNFCTVFTPAEMEDFEYGQDLYYYYMLGRENKWSAALGIPWLQIAVNKLNRTTTAPIASNHFDTDQPFGFVTDEATSKLPKPTTGPNATLSQPLHIWFTHREEVPLVTHALDLFHGHDDPSAEMPLDRLNPDRVWKTSEIIPFLGHVALERLQCDERVLSPASGEEHPQSHRKHHPKPITKPFVRIIVNGSPQLQPQCNSGPGGSCPLPDFIRYVQDLPSAYGDLETICEQPSG